MKRIKLTQGKFAIVDDSDFDWISQFNWNAHKTPSGDWYARRNVYHPHNQKTTHVYMHREIKGFPKCKVDHRDGNKLNNQRSNLRLASDSQNRTNSAVSTRNSTGLKGVSFHKRFQKFSASICLKRKRKHLGWFRDKIKAAMAYDSAAIKIHGRFSRTNKSLGLI